jgi:hypothetical protein
MSPWDDDSTGEQPKGRYTASRANRFQRGRAPLGIAGVGIALIVPPL